MTPGAQQLVDLVYLEARLIDEGRWEEWYAMYSDDAVYWIPLVPGQADGENHTSLMYEDKLLLRLRIERFSNPRSFSLQPQVRCLHVLQRPELDGAEPQENRWTMRTPELYVETQGTTQTVLAATVRHTFALVDGAPRIRVKRVDLLNCDAPLPSIQLFP
jgi:3-phenylpropionate/cinnamic acid dioxygenase small subunit